MFGDGSSISRFEGALLALGGVIWLVAAIDPVDRSAWFLENMVLVAAVAWVLRTHRKWRLSPISYASIFVFFVLHVVGAHYTYSATPIGDWLQGALGAERNHYDRLVHLLFGLLLIYPIKEQMGQAAGLAERPAFLMAFLLVVAVSTAYELLEWITAEIVAPQDAYAFLGTQGDAFDSQKDTALAVGGALLGIAISTLAKCFCGWLPTRWRSHRLQCD